jgi:hypothetical protein
LAGLGAVSSQGAALPSAYQEKVLAKKPVGYWRLGETTGTTAWDASKNGHNGVYVGKPALREPGAVHRDMDTAVKLDGHSYVEAPDHPGFSVPTSGRGLTVEVWMRPDVLEFEGDTSDPYIHWLGKGGNGRHEWALRFYSRKSSRPNRVSAYIFNPSGGLGSGAYFEDKLTPGKWLHVAACYDPGDKGHPSAGVSIYKNGVLRKGPRVPGSKGTFYSDYAIVPAHGTAPLRFGTCYLKNFLIGALDEVAIYPRVLTAAEIAGHYRTATMGG